MEEFEAASVAQNDNIIAYKEDIDDQTALADMSIPSIN